MLGLLPTGPHGYWVVKYGNTATMVVDYRGLIELVCRSGHVVSIQPHSVKEQDTFEELPYEGFEHIAHRLGSSEHGGPLTERKARCP